MDSSPAVTVIKAFGGVRPLARALGKSPSSVSRWAKPRRLKGTGGSIPTREQRRILDLAQERGIALSLSDVVLGG